MLPAPNRLRERSDFATAIRAPGATRAGSRILVVHANVTDSRAGLPPRVGFVVSKAVGNAVVRNRMKRRFRALVRETFPAHSIPGADHVLIGRSSGIERDYARLAAELERALAKLAA